MYTIYGKEDCSGCENAKRYLDSKGVAYNYVDISKDPVLRLHLVNQGFRSVPIINTGEELISSLSQLMQRLG